MVIKDQVKLARYTTYRIGGPARYFVSVKNEKDAIAALSFAREHKVPHFILGGGSNLVISDKGFQGLVIRMANKTLRWRKENDGNVLMEAGSGNSWDELVDAALSRGLQGIEWGAGIPGQLGGAVRGNAGAFGGETSDAIVSVKALMPDGEIKILKNSECAFGYRTSVFKEKGGVIISAVLRFAPGIKEDLLAVAKEKRDWRKAKHPLEYGNCGSVFKRVDLHDVKLGLWAIHPDMKRAVRDGQVATAYFIDECGLKRTRIGGAEVSAQHPNFIVNRTGKAKAEDIVMLTSLIRSRVHQKFGVILEEEPQFIT